MPLLTLSDPSAPTDAFSLLAASQNAGVALAVPPPPGLVGAVLAGVGVGVGVGVAFPFEQPATSAAATASAASSGRTDALPAADRALARVTVRAH